MGQITYAKVGGPPAYWQGLKVINLDTGQEVLDVIEVDAQEGWLISCRRNAEGGVYLDPENPDQVARQRVEGRFEIRRPD